MGITLRQLFFSGLTLIFVLAPSQQAMAVTQYEAMCQKAIATGQFSFGQIVSGVSAAAAPATTGTATSAQQAAGNQATNSATATTANAGAGQGILSAANACRHTCTQAIQGAQADPTLEMNMITAEVVSAIQAQMVKCDQLSGMASLSMGQAAMMAGVVGVAGFAASSLMSNKDSDKKAKGYQNEISNLRQQLEEERENNASGTSPAPETTQNLPQPNYCRLDPSSSDCMSAVEALAPQLTGCQSDTNSDNCIDAKNRCATQGQCISVVASDSSEVPATSLDDPSTVTDPTLLDPTAALNGPTMGSTIGGGVVSSETNSSSSSSNGSSSSSSGASINANGASGLAPPTGGTPLTNLGHCGRQPELTSTACYDVVNLYCYELPANQFVQDTTCSTFCNANPQADACTKGNTAATTNSGTLTSADIRAAQERLRGGRNPSSVASAQQQGGDCSSPDFVNSPQCFQTMRQYCGQYGLRGQGCLTFCAYNPKLRECK